MAIFRNKDNKELIVNCECGCKQGIHIRITDDDDYYAYETYLSGNFMQEQGRFLWKLKKIWAIIRNKDFYYAEICMTKEDWEEYKKWVNEH